MYGVSDSEAFRGDRRTTPLLSGMCTEYDPLRGADFLFFKSHGAERSGYPYVREITDFDGADFRE